MPVCASVADHGDADGGDRRALIFAVSRAHWLGGWLASPPAGGLDTTIVILDQLYPACSRSATEATRRSKLETGVRQLTQTLETPGYRLAWRLDR